MQVNLANGVLSTEFAGFFFSPLKGIAKEGGSSSDGHLWNGGGSREHRARSSRARPLPARKAGSAPHTGWGADGARLLQLSNTGNFYSLILQRSMQTFIFYK